MKRPLHRILEKLPNIQNSWVKTKSHAQANISINTCFSKRRSSLLWHCLSDLVCVTYLRALCFLYWYCYLLISYYEIVVTQVSKAWENRKSCEEYKWRKHHWERPLSGWVRISSRLSESCIKAWRSLCKECL